MKFSDLATLWLEDRESARLAGDLGQDTYKQYAFCARHLGGYFGNDLLMVIQRQRVDRYKANELDAGIKPSTINHRLNILRMMLTFAIEQEKLNTLPRWKRAKDIKRFDPIPAYDDVIKFLNKLPAEHMMALKFSLYTGLSWAEVRRLQWDDIDKDQILVGQRQSFAVKTAQRVRTVKMPKPVAQMIRTARVYAKDSPYVFPRAHLVSQTIRDFRSPKDPPVTARTMRRLFASRAAEVNIPESTLQQILGHAPGSRMTREHYIRVQQEAANDAVDKIAAAF